ncbi:DNA-directed RNA polymerase II subunit RPB11-b1-like protein [Gaertneriomyces semiglobifer]|nr:DNA-directed RNA polymerase II subunit RPB11-b1-like protein [Gaertneriomyces semiglobifer]
MSNAPATWEMYVLPEGQKKITVQKDTRIPNAATFHIAKEDHTLGNILRTQLLKNPKVLFAGYKMPHPLEYSFILKVQTTADTSPAQVLRTEIDALIREVGQIRLKFEVRTFACGTIWRILRNEIVCL